MSELSGAVSELSIQDAHSATGTGCVTGDGASKLVTGHWSASREAVTDMNWELECHSLNAVTGPKRAPECQPKSRQFPFFSPESLQNDPDLCLGRPQEWFHADRSLLVLI